MAKLCEFLYYATLLQSSHSQLRALPFRVLILLRVASLFAAVPVPVAAPDLFNTLQLWLLQLLRLQLIVEAAPTVK